MKALAAITDPVYQEPASYNALEKFYLKLIGDERDLPFVKWLVFLHLTVVPFGLFLFTPVLDGWWWYGVYAIYFYYSQIKVRGQFGLMYHCINHRRLFRKKFDFLNTYVVWAMGPFFGNTPETYHSHHIGMHHVEGNMPEDTSSTMDYKRDSFLHFLKYYFTFIFIGFYQTFMYFFARNKKKYYMRFTVGEWSFIIICTLLWIFVSGKATLFIFIIPVLFSRFIMMLGNWTQHAFVDPDQPDNIYRSAIICINGKYNHKCWNDGYHLIHHLKPGIHYTEYPNEFLRVKDEVAKNRGLIFERINYLHIFFYLMIHRYDKLEAQMVNINQSFASREDALNTLRERTRRIRNSS